jgi:hypothetical protein
LNGGPKSLPPNKKAPANWPGLCFTPSFHP